MSLRHNPEKARHYINALDIARCFDNWSEVPELVRKVQKHAPQRKCLTLTASSEHKVATKNLRPPTASFVRTTDQSTLIPTLRDCVEGEIPFYQDGLQAKVCLGWIYLTQAEPGQALSALPKDFGVVLQELAGNAKEPYGWTEVCVVKGAFMKASAQEHIVGKAEALETFKSIMSWLLERASKPVTSPQQLFWEEQFLARAATLATKEFTMNRENISFALTAFRLWAKLGASKHEFPPMSPDTSAGPVLAEAQVWKLYYDFLSKILQQGLPYPPSASLLAAFQKSEVKSKLPLRAQQVAEIRRCETVCESNFLRGVRFPKASGSNQEVEDWVEQVVKNWIVLCGPDWQDEELGEGGQNAIGRNVLDVLYRAASKTFHSTLILRRLFQVHASLTDFELAFKALSSYIEIMTRGQTRAETAEEAPVGLDDDETFLNTIGEGILIYCQFGGLKEAEKAKGLSDALEEALQKHPRPSHEQMVNGDGATNVDFEPPREEWVSWRTTSSAYRNMGIGLANWARWTPINESRSEIQTKAIRFLRKALFLKGQGVDDLKAKFALGLLLAETRDINGAIDAVKEALASHTPASPQSKQSKFTSGARKDYQMERHLIPLWHLLSLLLSGRQDFDTAVRSCEAAFEQFPSPSVLFGQSKPVQARFQEGDTEKKPITPFPLRSEQLRGVVDDMQGGERERILEIRMTELALTEVLEGPELAVNASNELLSLFLRLFGDLGIDMEDPKAPPAPAPIPPKSSSGTLASFKGSIFGRKRHPRTSLLREAGSNAAALSTGPNEKSVSQVGNDFVDPPKIQVTDDALMEKDNSIRRSHRSQNPDSHQPHKLHRREGSLSKRLRRHSEERKPRPSSSHYSSSSQRQSLEVKKSDFPSRTSSQQRPRTYHGRPSEPPSDQVGLAVSPDILQPPDSPTPAHHDGSPRAKQSLPSVAHNIPHHKAPPPPGHSKQPPQQDIRLPAVRQYSTSTQPQPRFPKAQAHKHALAILIKIWLLIASLYRRASMFDDAKEACEEAFKHATQVEALVAAQESSARAFAESGWGTRKSSDELWADIFAERGYLALAESSPHMALELFEKAVWYYPDHLKATIGLASILLDISDQKIPPEPPRPSLETGMSTVSLSPTTPAPLTKQNTNTSLNSTKPLPALPSSTPRPNLDSSSTNPTSSSEESQRKTPASLNRIAARDRAYGLLSTLTKLGTAWDSSEAWFALSRAYEAGGEVERAKEILWWVIELEDRRPVRHWWNLGGGYVL